ncbi:MAG: ABC transporter ATP-binding protein [Candidatus Hodarchaeota archaeon]
MTDVVLTCKELFKLYGEGVDQVPAIKGLDLEIDEKEIITLIGPSGCGKTTLVEIIGGFELPSSGLVLVKDLEIPKLNYNQRVQYRRNIIGMLFQHPRDNLIWNLSIFKNIELPLKISGHSREFRVKRVSELLKLVDLVEKQRVKPHQLSGGQLQRISVCVSLANQPELLIMDEPTGDLDRNNTISLIKEFENINASEDTAILITTHDPVFSQYVKKSYQMIDGRIAGLFIYRSKDLATFYSRIDSGGYLHVPADLLAHLRNPDFIRLELSRKGINIVSVSSMSTETEDNIFYTIVNPNGTIHIPKDLQQLYNLGTDVELKKDGKNVLISVHK